MKRLVGFSILICIFLLNLSAFADTVNGNGYVLNQSISTATVELEGNGYTATQTVSPIYGELIGEGYSSVSASPNDSIPLVPPQSAVTPPVEPSQGFSVSGGRIAFLDDAKEVVSSIAVPDIVSQDAASNERLSNQLDKLIEPFVGDKNTKSLSELYSDLGAVIKEQSGKDFTTETLPVVVQAVGEVFNSKSTFSILTMSVVVLLFMSLGVSVFGYKEVHKIISAVVCVGSLFGYYTASQIYLLPAIVGFLVLIIFLIQQKEREVLPRVTSRFSPQ